jgi:hypothetical protein
MGEIKKIQKLKKVWELTLGPVKNGMILNCAVDPTGVK